MVNRVNRPCSVITGVLISSAVLRDIIVQSLSEASAKRIVCCASATDVDVVEVPPLKALKTLVHMSKHITIINGFLTITPNIELLPDICIALPYVYVGWICVSLIY